MTWICTGTEGVVLSLRVIPRAPRNAVQGVLGDALKIKLKAPPVDGKANKALIEFLSEQLQIRPGCIAILAGESGRNKKVRLTSITESEARARLTAQKAPPHSAS